MLTKPTLGEASFIPHPSSSIWALVPTKELLRAKTRLARVLTPTERRALVLAMVEDVLGTLAAAPDLRGVAMMSREPAVRILAARYGALLLDDTSDDLNAALRSGASQLLARGANGLIVVPADVPLVAANDVTALAGALQSGAQLALVPAHDDGGTNALALALPSPFQFQFGEDSFARHLSQGTQHGFAVAIHRSATLGLDIDTVDDLCLLDEMPGAPVTHALLREIAFHPCGV